MVPLPCFGLGLLLWKLAVGPYKQFSAMENIPERNAVFPLSASSKVTHFKVKVYDKRGETEDEELLQSDSTHLPHTDAGDTLLGDKKEDQSAHKNVKKGVDPQQSEEDEKLRWYASPSGIAVEH
ncbi:hypothetical protein B0H14DRAFT_2591042 [Mycena olivaceomarginata]|nr:hypothetical protein B0H14DRAFT_2591042 [Mycena olivaceomarginata]